MISSISGVVVILKLTVLRSSSILIFFNCFSCCDFNLVLGPQFLRGIFLFFERVNGGIFAFVANRTLLSDDVFLRWFCLFSFSRYVIEPIMDCSPKVSDHDREYNCWSNLFSTNNTKLRAELVDNDNQEQDRLVATNRWKVFPYLFLLVQKAPIQFGTSNTTEQ